MDSDSAPPNPTREEYQRELFMRTQQPVFWLLQARSLRHAAEIIIQSQIGLEREDGPSEYALFEDGNHPDADDDAGGYPDEKLLRITNGYYVNLADKADYGPSRLLYAFAMENLIKGYIVAIQPGLIGKDKLDAVIGRHNLVELSRLARITLSEVERHLMHGYMDIIKWHGRYPTARTAKETMAAILPSRQLSDEASAALTGHARYRLQQRRLYERVDGMVYDWIAVHMPSDVVYVPPIRSLMGLP